LYELLDNPTTYLIEPSGLCVGFLDPLIMMIKVNKDLFRFMQIS